MEFLNNQDAIKWRVLKEETSRTVAAEKRTEDSLPAKQQESNVGGLRNECANPAVVHRLIELAENLKTLMETVESEDLSMLICDVEDGERGVIFDHLRQPYSTILTRIGYCFWHVYYSDGTKIKRENIHVLYSLQDACRTALRLARAAKNRPGEGDAETNHHLMYWTLDAKGTLTLSGEGPMPCVSIPRYNEVCQMQIAHEARAGNPNLPSVGDIQYRPVTPWAGYKVRKVVVLPGLTTLSDGAFFYFHSDDSTIYYSDHYHALTEIILPDTMEKLGKNSIECCWNLRKVVIPNSVTSIYEEEYSFVFADCRKLVLHTTKGSYAEAYAKRKGIAAVIR